MNGPSVVLYSKGSCHLCDEARAVIMAEHARRAFLFEEVVIDGHENLERAYALRVPVVTVNGDDAFEFFVNAADLRRLLGR
jgi:glutaredoxin